MHPYRVILRKYRRSDGLYMRQDVPNTLTCQSAGTNDAPRDLLRGLVIWNPNPSIIYGLQLWQRIRHRNPCRRRNHREHAVTPRSRQLSGASDVIGIGILVLFAFSKFIQLAVSDLIRLTVSELV